MNNFLIKVLTTGIKLPAGIGAAVFIQSEKDKKDTQNSVNNIHEPPTPSNHEDLEYTANIPPEWQQWKTVYRRFTERPPIKHQDIYVPDCLWEIKTVEIPKISMTEKEAEAFGYSFRKKSKRIRITNYHGLEKSIIIPTYIGDMLVNEIGANAFTNSRVERVAIPDNIKKLGESAFAESNVQFVIFGKGIREIPKMCFYNCKKLKIAAIPPLTEKLGEKAFFGCRSLKYIELPWELREIGEDCFCGSGLEGFAARFRSSFYPDGSAFANTPLHQNNDLILYRRYDPSNSNDKMTVLLVGQNANVKFTEPRVHLGKNSVCAPCSLDFTECGNFSTNGAFKCKPGYIDNTEEPPKIRVYVPENGCCGSFPEFVNTSSSKKWTTTLKTDCFCTERHIRINEDLCAYSLKLRAWETVIDIDHKLIDTEAIIARYLETVEINGDFRANGGIFAHVCRRIYEVKWKNSKGEFQSYIPSGQVIGRDIHRELLKAFCGNGADGFFDPKVIENVFENGVVREKSKTHIELSHREKILIAIDVLRSSPELYPDGTEKYSRFLKRHIDYAKKMCGKLRDHPKYLEFLKKFAPKQGDVQ